MIGKAAAQGYNMSLPPEIAEALRVTGGNNLSAGFLQVLLAFAPPKR